MAVKKALQCDGIYLTQANGAAAGQTVFHVHFHVYPCWEGQEIKAIARFFQSVTDRGNMSRETRTAMVEAIQRCLADDGL
jgi:histidine triad (HIT) family protein